jgi:gamma-tubulin complex component 3
MDPQDDRVEWALSQLVDHFLPATDYEDEFDAEARQDEVLERAHDTIDRCSSTADIYANPNWAVYFRYQPTETVLDIQHLGDLIKKKRADPISTAHRMNWQAAVIRDNPTTEQAKKFGSLYTRLLTQPVLSQKWGVLKFLLELSSSREEGGHASETVIVAHSSGERENDNEQAFSAAFSGQGLHRLPVRGAPQNTGEPEHQNGDQTGMLTKADLLAARGDGIGTPNIRMSSGCSHWFEE